MVYTVIQEDLGEGLLLLILASGLALAAAYLFHLGWDGFRSWMRERHAQHVRATERIGEIDQLYRRTDECLQALQSHGMLKDGEDTDPELPYDVDRKTRAIREIYTIAHDPARWKGELIPEE